MAKALRVLAAVCLLVSAGSSLHARGSSGDDRIEEIIESMSVEERVGQVFMIDFVGSYTTEQDAFVELIRDYKVGSVVLTWPNNNIQNEAENTPLQVAELSNRLQQLAYDSSRHEGEEGESYFLPLFIAVDHEGDGYPRTHFRSGATPIPSAMAIGATWKPEDAREVGEIIGRELQALGVNMLLGPVVDVLLQPRPEGAGDMHVRVLGGDPYWVGQMGRAYVRGVHEGSGGGVLTVAKHFPGHGASDRVPDDHVPTVNKTLEALEQSDLVPFLQLTNLDPANPQATADAMMPSHIRYRGFQGDAGQLTHPISLDPEGMAAFFDIPTLSEWRSQGGLIVCDSLGVGGIKEFYDPDLESFPHREVARQALMSGNDVLPIVNYRLSGGWFTDSLPNIKDTIDYFREQYQTDTAFRARVDDALRHILAAKLKLYPNLSLEETQVSTDHLDEVVGQGEDEIYQIALDGLSLLYPNQQRLESRLPSAPRRGENILITGCFEECLSEKRLSASAITSTLLSLYGPTGSNTIAPSQIDVLDFAVLHELLNETLEADQIEEARGKIERADWILMALTEYRDTTVPATTAGRRFLQSLDFKLQGKKIIAIAYGAPYYLTASEIGRLTAYYAVYSKIDPYIKASLQAVFKQAVPTTGAPPVSVPGIGYELQNELEPDRDQTIAIEPAHAEELIPGHSVEFTTSPILDHNDHLVRDDTPVEFGAALVGTDQMLAPAVVTDTVNGIAKARFRFPEAGTYELSGHCGAVAFEPLTLLVAEPTPVATATQPMAEIMEEPAMPTEAETPTETRPSVPVSPTPRNGSPGYRVPIVEALIGAVATIIAAIASALAVPWISRRLGRRRDGD